MGGNARCHVKQLGSAPVPEYVYIQYADMQPREVVPHYWRPFPKQQLICYKKIGTEIFRTFAPSILDADKLFEAATGINPSKTVEIGCQVNN